MKKLILIIFFISPLLFAQDIQWASKVIYVSSELGSREFSGMQLLGAPEMFPQGGFYGCSWTSKDPDSPSELIHLGFEKEIHVRKIFIAESFRPGSISKIILIDNQKNEHEVYYQAASKIDTSARLFQLTIPKTKYLVKEIKVQFQNFAVENYSYIDAVGISSEDVKFNMTFESDSSLMSIKLEPLSNKINSSYDESFPKISSDGKTLYFIRKSHPSNTPPVEKADIWYSELNNNGEWTESKKLSKPLNNEFYNYVSSISNDGKTLFLNNSYGDKNSGISKSEFKNGKWTKPESVLIKDVNSFGKFSSYSINEDGNILLMDLERVDSYGGNDIYVSFLEKNNTWTEPMNLGNSLNSKCDDYMPFLASDNKTIYFVSYGYPGYGSGDLFMSRRLDDSWTSWTKPLNLGPKINSPGLEGGLNISSNGEYAYLFSNYNSIGGEDIHRFKLPKIIKPKIVETPNPIVLFNYNSFELESDEKEKLNELISYLIDNEYSTIDIYAFTDSVGTNESNLNLSLKRAENVKHYLIKNAILENQIKVFAKGEDSSTKEDHLKRRVEFKITYNQ